MYMYVHVCMYLYVRGNGYNFYVANFDQKSDFKKYVYMYCMVNRPVS